MRVQRESKNISPFQIGGSEGCCNLLQPKDQSRNCTNRATGPTWWGCRRTRGTHLGGRPGPAHARLDGRQRDLSSVHLKAILHGRQPTGLATAGNTPWRHPVGAEQETETRIPPDGHQELHSTPHGGGGAQRMNECATGLTQHGASLDPTRNLHYPPMVALFHLWGTNSSAHPTRPAGPHPLPMGWHDRRTSPDQRQMPLWAGPSTPVVTTCRHVSRGPRSCGPARSGRASSPSKRPVSLA